MKKTFIGLLLGLACCFVLSACGSSNSTPDTPTPPPPPVSQNLTDRVEGALVLNDANADSIEAESIEAVTVTEPDDSEPKSI